MNFKLQDGPPNERKIVKLCEYAAKNPFRIPKVVPVLWAPSYVCLTIKIGFRSEHKS